MATVELPEVVVADLVKLGDIFMDPALVAVLLMLALPVPLIAPPNATVPPL
jgi:hypothetical protein